MSGSDYPQSMKRLLFSWLTVALCSRALGGNDLADLNIDQLMNMEITTASKREQKLSDTPAAVFVLTRDDIQRSGATTLPELLLNVPGVEGGAINRHTQAIGIRGFGGQWSNKLVVLIDGRSIYTRTFSGVYWDSYNIPFEDIERIEVIRGANAALWGANAVNGVINIITRHSADAQGTLLRGTIGERDESDALLRHGFKLGEQGYARVHAVGERHAASAGHPEGAADDAWENRRVGFRADWTTAEGDRLMLKGDSYRLRTDNYPLDPDNMPPDVVPIGLAVEPESTMRGSSLLANFTHAYALSAEWMVQLAWSRADRDEFLPLVENSYDLDFQHRFQPFDGHDLVWGANVRYREDRSTPTPYIAFAPSDESDTNASLFFQDEIAAGERLRITVGSRFEHDRGEWEIQPSLRALWSIDANHKIWAAVSRSARTPSRVDRDVAANVPARFTVPAFGVVPAELHLRGSADFETEEMRSYELGYRVRPSASLSFDLALFYNRYDNLRTVDFGGYAFTADGLVIDAPMGNAMTATMKGAELVANWSPSDQWRLQMFWSEQRLRSRDSTGWPGGYSISESYDGSSPERQIGLRADLNLTARWYANLQLKYVDQLELPFNPSLLQNHHIPAYTDADINLGWRLTPHWELSLLGKNLLDRSRLEYSSESGARPTEVRRATYLRATWSF